MYMTLYSAHFDTHARNIQSQRHTLSCMSMCMYMYILCAQLSVHIACCVNHDVTAEVVHTARVSGLLQMVVEPAEEDLLGREGHQVL